MKILNGSELQVKWANEIREEVLNTYELIEQGLNNIEMNGENRKELMDVIFGTKELVKEIEKAQRIILFFKEIQYYSSPLEKIIFILSEINSNRFQVANQYSKTLEGTELTKKVEKAATKIFKNLLR